MDSPYGRVTRRTDRCESGIPVAGERPGRDSTLIRASLAKIAPAGSVGAAPDRGCVAAARATPARRRAPCTHSVVTSRRRALHVLAFGRTANSSTRQGEASCPGHLIACAIGSARARANGLASMTSSHATSALRNQSLSQPYPAIRGGLIENYWCGPFVSVGRHLVNP
jgi:hypothetical protein